MKKILSFAKKYPLATFIGGMLFAGTAYGIKAMATVKSLGNKAAATVGAN